MAAARSSSMRHIAIIGSGPAGCYLAESLLRFVPDVSIDVIERLPVPFGLVRAGVAPDHQSTKAVARVLDRILARDRVAFFGNVEVGRDVRLEELTANYDAVALAVGAPRDRRLGVPGEDLAGVIGSGAFSGWYNSQLNHVAPPLSGIHSVVVIGNGNVAIDVVRVLAKDDGELAGSDLGPGASSLLAAQPLEEIHIVGRRGPADAKFTEHELAELGALRRARPVIVEPGSFAGETPVVEILRRFHAEERPPAAIAIQFHFRMMPAGFIGRGQLETVRFRRSDGSVHDLAAQLAVTCIGYEARACCTLEPDGGIFRNDGGKIRDGLYVVGWAKRGPTGTIPTNRAEAQEVAQKIASEVTESNRAGRDALRKLLDTRGVHWIDHARWRRIDVAEIARAQAGRCRDKFMSVEEMLRAARNA
ncbi:MAG: FAD-dependent oxidoreductase [Candidatus Acidiferrales bacterium]